MFCARQDQEGSLNGASVERRRNATTRVHGPKRRIAAGLRVLRGSRLDIRLRLVHGKRDSGQGQKRRHNRHQNPRKMIRRPPISPIEDSGPTKAPAVVEPTAEARARAATGPPGRAARSAISASRGAPRMPLADAVEEARRDSQPMLGAERDRGFHRGKPEQGRKQACGGTEPIRQRPEKIRDRGGRLRGRPR